MRQLDVLQSSAPYAFYLKIILGSIMRWSSEAELKIKENINTITNQHYECVGIKRRNIRHGKILIQQRNIVLQTL